jgi:hypothetical protein
VPSDTPPTETSQAPSQDDSPAVSAAAADAGPYSYPPWSPSAFAAADSAPTTYPPWSPSAFAVDVAAPSSVPASTPSAVDFSPAPVQSVSEEAISSAVHSLGCIAEVPGRALQDSSMSSDFLTVAKCTKYCHSRGFAFAGLEHGTSIIHQARLHRLMSQLMSVTAETPLPMEHLWPAPRLNATCHVPEIRARHAVGTALSSCILLSRETLYRQTTLWTVIFLASYASVCSFR